jgi:hypothetical protein
MLHLGLWTVQKTPLSAPERGFLCCPLVLAYALANGVDIVNDSL